MVENLAIPTEIKEVAAKAPITPFTLQILDHWLTNRHEESEDTKGMQEFVTDLSAAVEALDFQRHLQSIFLAILYGQANTIKDPSGFKIYTIQGFLSKYGRMPDIPDLDLPVRVLHLNKDVVHRINRPKLLNRYGHNMQPNILRTTLKVLWP